MNSKTILGISLAAAFAVSMMIPAYAGMPSNPLEITAVDVTATGSDPILYDIKITRAGPIPTDGSLFGGYAVFSDSPLNKVLVLASHLCFSDSSQQGDANCGTETNVHDDDAWHPHILFLKKHISDACASHDAEIDLKKTTANSKRLEKFDATYTVTVMENMITVDDVPETDVSGGGFTHAASFVIAPEVDSDSNLHLCLDISDSESVS